MGDHDETPERKLRSDAVRNRERILEAAKIVFNTGGPDATVEAVARRAEVGIGTLYRHFATREALFEATYRREVDQLAALAMRLATDMWPVQALRKWLLAYIELVATKKGMAVALALMAHKPPELYAYSFETLSNAARELLGRAVAAGEIRDDVTAEDLLRTLVGMCNFHEQPGWQVTVARLMNIFIDGLTLGKVGR